MRRQQDRCNLVGGRKKKKEGSSSRMLGGFIVNCWRSPTFRDLEDPGLVRLVRES